MIVPEFITVGSLVLSNLHYSPSTATTFVTQVVYAEDTPTPEPTSSSGVMPITSSYTPGWCGIHVHEWKENCPGCHGGEVTVNVYDAKQEQIAFINSMVDYGDLKRALYPEQRMPKSLTINLGKDITFKYGDDKWVAAEGEKGRCTVGKWNKSVGHTTRDMDCGFTC